MDIKEVLFKSKNVKKFCLENNLSDEDIRKNARVLSLYKEQNDYCLKCDKTSCSFDNFNLDIIFEDNEVKPIYKECNIKNETNLLVLNYTKPDFEIELTNPRLELFKYFDKFTNEYFSKKKAKGIYLFGRCGTGKSVLMYKFITSLSNKGLNCIFSYYPDLVRLFQTSFGTDLIEDLIYRLKTCDILVLDDIGRESNSAYIRDEILGPILQHRCDNNLPLFITSNRSYSSLEEHLSETNNTKDATKAKAIIERIKFLTYEFELNDRNYRNN